MLIGDLYSVRPVPLKHQPFNGSLYNWTLINQVAIANAYSWGGTNNIGSPAIAIAMNIAPVTQVPIF